MFIIEILNVFGYVLSKIIYVSYNILVEILPDVIGICKILNLFTPKATIAFLTGVSPIVISIIFFIGKILMKSIRGMKAF